MTDIKLDDKVSKKIEALFLEFHKRLSCWMNNKPTGNVSLNVDVNQGGIRGANIEIKEKI